MRPKISSVHSIARSLFYNEEKILLGKAECLVAKNFLKESSQLTLEGKLHCFERRMELNDRVSTSQHITLNFDPSDKLSNEQMKEIAVEYMQQIGFERQPYLVYRHHDAGHPHCHIVTTHIRSDGSPIDLYNIGRRQSEAARLHLENKFGLVTAEMKRQTQQEKQEVNGIPMVCYGKEPTARAISRVVKHVSDNYHYTTLQEFNTALRIYRVEAYRGKEDSALYQHRGLLYRALDEHGKYIGVPLKASFFDFKPTLDNLEKKFAQNLERTELKQQSRLYVSTFIRRTMMMDCQHNLSSYAYVLGEERIRVAVMQDKTRTHLDVIYIDLRNRCVVNGNELKEGNPEAIQDMMTKAEALRKERALHPEEQVYTHRRSLRF